MAKYIGPKTQSNAKRIPQDSEDYKPSTRMF